MAKEGTEFWEVKICSEEWKGEEADGPEED